MGGAPARPLADRILVMKPGPGRIAARFGVDLERPRRRGAHALEAMRQQIADLIITTADVERLAS